jgi:hypothetical protein
MQHEPKNNNFFITDQTEWHSAASRHAESRMITVCCYMCCMSLFSMLWCRRRLHLRGIIPMVDCCFLDSIASPNRHQLLFAPWLENVFTGSAPKVAACGHCSSWSTTHVCEKGRKTVDFRMLVAERVEIQWLLCDEIHCNSSHG